MVTVVLLPVLPCSVNGSSFFGRVPSLTKRLGDGITSTTSVDLVPTLIIALTGSFVVVTEGFSVTTPVLGSTE